MVSIKLMYKGKIYDVYEIKWLINTNLNTSIKNVCKNKYLLFKIQVHVLKCMVYNNFLLL